eukprot:TRINITY_DN3171_c0_g2_i1.p1 TRINITY_DN3171_c0_g2~~TRINITY_DN3171_c0_g2_i1.p1  ORF type:complete len:183 (-),score=76.89 TRINITY_DN3171_c0_g2_i1:301-849(-)
MEGDEEGLEEEVVAPLVVDSKNPGKSVVERYFTQYFAMNEQFEDQYVYKHFNNLFVIGLASTHFAFKNGEKTIKSVNFDVSSRSRLNNQVSGKGKKGGIQLKPNDPLCSILLSDGSSFTVKSCVTGSLLEVNEKLLEDPSLLSLKNETDGFIAIIQPKFGDKDKVDHLSTQEEYKRIRNIST